MNILLKAGRGLPVLKQPTKAINTHKMGQDAQRIKENATNEAQLPKGQGIAFWVKETIKNRVPYILPIVTMCVLLSAVTVLPAFGQETDGLNKITPIRVGDKVPPEFWTKEHILYRNGDTIRMTLEHLRGKPFIIDFWATWCGVCIQNFKKIYGFRKDVYNNIDIVLVNSDVKDDLKGIGKVMSESSHFQGDIGQSIVFDTYLLQLFPHLGIPHYIWIDNTDRVRAITIFDFVTLDAIQKFVRRSRGLYW